MSDSKSVQRLVVCVDGAKKSLRSSGHENESTISRIASIVKEGLGTTSQGTYVNQTVIYTPAVEESSSLLTPFKSKDIGLQIEILTKSVCEKLNGPQDEVFFFGSGHGAFIARAVAGVLHHMGLPKSWLMVRFHEIYVDALDLYKAKCEENRTRGLKLVKKLQTQCDGPPQIKFVGVFDTIGDKADAAVFDLGFNASVKTFRHALAVNENGASPVDIQDLDSDPNRSLVQAWFVGNNEDLCGGVQQDGLSLYPLQWMLVEALQAGLVIAPPTSESQSNPLSLVFPQYGGGTPIIDSGEQIEWQTKYTNGFSVSMFDLQPTHAINQVKGQGSHSVHLKGENPLYQQTRRVFNANGLVGWSEKGSCSTIVHPSVYCLLDRYPRLQENSRLKAIKKGLADFQEQNMESSDNALPPWLEGMQLQANGVKAFRILVCGKTGVGKSTLINKVFGVELTQESNTYAQGVHDINEAFESPSHPGLLVHDSRGWQAGSNQELDLIAKFLRRRAFPKDPTEALHVIWFCVDSDVNRIEEADRKTFEIITQYSHHVPIFIVGTKKDKIANFRKMQLLEKHMEANDVENLKKLNEIITRETEQHVQEQFSKLISEFATIKHFRADGHLCLSKSDDKGITELLTQTLGLIADERVRLFCVAAQVVSVDQKVSAAISETIRLGTHAIRTALVPLPCSGIVGTPTVSRILCEHVLQCFGFPKAAPEAIEEIMSRVVMVSLKKYMAVAMTQFLITSSIAIGVGVATMGIGTILGAGGSVFAAPPAARMLLKCACDMILILERSFRYGGKLVSVKQIEDAAKYYTKTTVKTFGGKDQLLQQRVHEEVEKMIPLRSVTTSWKFASLRVGFEEIIANNRFEKPPVTSLVGRSSSSLQTTAEMEGNHTAPVEIGEPAATIVELEGDLAKSPAELPGGEPSEPVTVSVVSKSEGSSYGFSSNASTLGSVSELSVEQDFEGRSIAHRGKSDSSATSRWRRSASKMTAPFSLKKSKSAAT